MLFINRQVVYLLRGCFMGWLSPCWCCCFFFIFKGLVRVGGVRWSGLLRAGDDGQKSNDNTGQLFKCCLSIFWGSTSFNKCMASYALVNFCDMALVFFWGVLLQISLFCSWQPCVLSSACSFVYEAFCLLFDCCACIEVRERCQHIIGMHAFLRLSDCSLK